MQQTETYKLNKPETTDPFTPAPLNENADKLESELTRVDAAVAQCRAENCLVKLGGPLVAQANQQELVFDLSGVDMGQFAALLFIGSTNMNSAILKINYDANSAYALTNTGESTTGFALLINSGNGKLGMLSTYTDYGAKIGHTYREVNYTIAALKKLSISGQYHAGTHYTLYAFKK